MSRAHNVSPTQAVRRALMRFFIEKLKSGNLGRRVGQNPIITVSHLVSAGHLLSLTESGTTESTESTESTLEMRPTNG